MVSNINYRGRFPKRAIGIVILMTLIASLPANAAVTATSVEVRGTVANATALMATGEAYTWNYANFADFWYDLKDNKSTESLIISSFSGERNIAKGNLTYSTHTEPIQFKVSMEKNRTVEYGLDAAETIQRTGGMYYDVVGWMAEKYVGINAKTNKLSKLVYEQDTADTMTLTVGQTWEMGSGYTLTVQSINASSNPKLARLILRKDGAKLNDKDIEAASADGTGTQGVYTYYANISGESNVPIFVTYCDSMVSDMVHLKYTWLIDSMVTEVKSSDIYGIFKVETETPDLILKSDSSVSLSKDSVVTLIGNLKFRVSDSNNGDVRFYPMVIRNTPGTWEVRGSIANSTALGTTGTVSWDSSNFAGFWYDLKTNQSTETLNVQSFIDIRTIDKGQLWYYTSIAPTMFKVASEKNRNVEYGLDPTGRTIISTGAQYYDVVGWMGEKYVANNGKNNKLAKLVYEQDAADTMTLTVGQTWELGDGYTLKAQGIDNRSNPRLVWFVLSKDGTKLDDKIIEAADSSKNGTTQGVYTYNANIGGESNVPIFVTYIESVFSDMVELKYTWLIDSKVTELKAGDMYGIFKVDTENPLSLKSNSSVSLTRASTVTLAGDLKFRISDSPDTDVRFYPKIDYVIPEGVTLPYSLNISINHGEAYTNSTSVALSLSAINATNMSLSNDGLTWSPWEPFVTAKSWMLSSGDGLKIVSFKAKNAAGNASTVSDSIILDTIPPSLNRTSPVNISFVANRSAIITWRTNNFADSLIKYGITPGNYSFNVHLNQSVTFHNVILTNLSSDTDYYFIINSTDATDSMQSQEFIFWTPYDTFQGNPNLTNIEIQQLTDYEELASSPVWIEDKIFYASNRSGNMDVWVMDKDGSNKTQITNSSSEEYPSDGWVLSENNSKIYKIIYVSRINGHSSIWIIDGDGTNSTQLINDSYENLDPVLVSVPLPVIFEMQPSGTIDNNVPLINASYYSYYGNISKDKVNISVDGSDVTSNASISASNLSYIPTKPLGMGRHNFTVQVETDKNTKGLGSQSFDIRYIYNTSPQSCIVLNDTPRISANISVGYGNISSVVMILDGINVTSNLTIYPTYIEYIPNVPLVNGSHSVYAEVNTEVKSTKGFSDNKTWTFILNNSMIPIPCSNPGSGGGGDGGGGYQKIIFASNRSGNFDLWMMNLNGTGLEQMNYEPSNETSPAWIESKVVYVSDKSGNKDIWSMDVNGSNKKQLTNSVLDENMPSSSYVGGIIYTESKDNVSNLYAMNTNGTGNIKITNSSSFKAIPAYSSMSSQLNEGILYGSEGKGQSAIYRMDFEEKGPKAKFWNLYENYSLQAFSIDTKSIPAQAWLNLKRNGIPKDDRVVRVGEVFSIVDTGKVIFTAILNKISSSDNYFEVELLNVTQYPSIAGSPLFTNETKILVNKILLIIPTPTPTSVLSGNSRNTGNSGYNSYTGSGSSGVGGGGGGGSSGENYSNIEVVEKYDMQISKDVLTSYRFTHAKNPIMFVNITGNTSIGIITASMEVLKNTSSFVNVTPEGLVYKNLNIWVGTSGFATPKNIKEALIKFRIDNAWMSANGVLASDIVLMKWEGKSWIKLETKVLSKDDLNTYVEGKTNSFSPFAIVAKTAAAPKPTVTRTPVETPKVTATETATPEPTKEVPGFGVVLALLGFMAVFSRWRGW